LSRTSAIVRGCGPGKGNDSTGAETAAELARKCCCVNALALEAGKFDGGLSAFHETFAVGKGRNDETQQCLAETALVSHA
jgi:hypothetical protein